MTSNLPPDDQHREFAGPDCFYPDEYPLDENGQPHRISVAGHEYFPPPNRARVPVPRTITPVGREMFLHHGSIELISHPEEPNGFLFYSHSVASNVQNFAELYRLINEAAQWHVAIAEQCLDTFSYALLYASDPPITQATTEGEREMGGVAFIFPVQFQPMLDGFAFLLHQEIFRVRIEDTAQKSEAVAREIERIRERNDRLGFRMPSSLRTVAQLQQDSAAYQEQITVIHSNTADGSTPKLLADEYGINIDTMHHHLDEALRRGIISQKKNFNSEEVVRLRQFMNGKSRRSKKPKT